MGKTLVLPITWNKATAKMILGNKQNEMLMLNGVRGSLKQTDFEWCCWDKNDLISFTIDLQQKEKMPEPLNPVKFRPSLSRNLVYSLSTVVELWYLG